MQHYFTSSRQNQNVFRQLNCDAAYLLSKITTEFQQDLIDVRFKM